jgi:hypothetical protein
MKGADKEIGGVGGLDTFSMKQRGMEKILWHSGS